MKKVTSQVQKEVYSDTKENIRGNTDKRVRDAFYTQVVALIVTPVWELVKRSGILSERNRDRDRD